MQGLSTNQVFQSAWVVADFEQAVATWAERYGVGPFYAVDFASGPELRYRGQPGQLAMKVAWAQAGDVQVELIAPLSDSPNVYRDLVPAGQTRFHHVCFWSDDIAADKAVLQAEGFELAMDSGDGDGARFAYFDTSAENGHMIELLQRDAGMAAMFDRIAVVARDWDGERPLREFAELAV